MCMHMYTIHIFYAYWICGWRMMYDYVQAWNLVSWYSSSYSVVSWGIPLSQHRKLESPPWLYIYTYTYIQIHMCIYIYIMSKRLSPRGYPCCQVGHEPKMLMELGDNPLKTHRSKAGKLNPLDLGKATGEWSVKLWSCDFQEMDRNGGDSKRI